MLNLPIEQEIEHEDYIIGKLTKRQLICLGVLVAVVGLTYMMTRNVVVSAIVAIPVAFLAVYFGWKVENGLHGEDLLRRKLQQKYFNNNIRPYRTQNKYFRLFNKRYNQMRAADMKNKAKAKAMAAEAKKKPEVSKRYTAIY